MPVVNVPGVGHVNFPDTMSDEAIANAIKSSPDLLGLKSPGVLGKEAIAVNPPKGLQPEKDNFFTSPNGLIRSGGRKMMEGIEAMSEPGARAKMGGASQVIRGGMEAATPVALPFMAANPLSAVAAIGLGTGAGKVAHAGLSLIGAPPEAQDLGEDVAGIGAGSLTAMHPDIPVGAMRGGYRGATDMVPLSRYGHKLNVPAPLAGAAAGELLGYGLHGLAPNAPAIGAGIGAAMPIVKGAFEGARDAYHAGRTVSRPVPARSPLWDGEASTTPDVGPVQGPLSQPQLPSGRTPGPAPVAPPVPPPVPARTPLWQQNTPQTPSPVTDPIQAANQDSHPPAVTQADEFKPPSVAAPVPVAGAQTPTAPPVAAPQGVTAAPGATAPMATQTPTNATPPAPQNPIIPPANLVPKGGETAPVGELDSRPTESAVDVIKPGTEDPADLPITNAQHPAVQKVDSAITNLVNKVVDHVLKPESDVTLIDLENIQRDIEGDDAAKAWLASSKLKEIVNEASPPAKPNSRRAVSKATLGAVIQKLKQAPSQP